MADEVQEVFHFHDRTGSGTLTVPHIANAIHALGIAATTAHVESLIAQHGSSLSLDKFRNVVEAAKVLVAKDIQSLPSLFAVLDDDKDGLISKVTLRHYLTSIGNKMSVTEVDELFASKNVSESINLDMFCKLLTA